MDNVPPSTTSSESGSGAENVSNKFLQKLQEKKKLLEQQEQPIEQRYLEDVPDIDLTPQISPEQKALDDFIRLLPITEAYTRWVNKPNKSPILDPYKKEIKVSCPNPDHLDKNPSCSLNTEKQVFMCFKCGGGDVWDIAAWNKGFPVPGYKKDPQMFRTLRELIGLDYGIQVTRGIAGDEYLVISPNAPNAAPDVAPNAAASGHDAAPNDGGDATDTAHIKDASVTYTPVGAEQAEKQFEQQLTANRLYPEIPWRSIVPQGTFLYEYLQATTVDDAPEEFHFWAGLIALGMAVGRMRVLEDSPEVIGNLFVCFTSGTGTGKSKAKRHLINLIHESLPYRKDDQPPFGVNVIQGVQSGEYLVKSFMHPMIDPNGNQIGYWPAVRGLIDFEELMELVTKSRRQGSTLKPIIMNMYDSPRAISSGSLTHGTFVAEYPVASVITTTQLKAVKDLISRSDDASGFANRWVFATGKLKEPFAINRIKVDLTRAGGLLRIINHNARAPETILWEPAAEKAWADFFHSTIVPYRKSNPDAEITQRIDLLLKKLFLLFTVNLQAKTVTKQTVDSVLQIYPHLLETYQIIDQQISSTVEIDKQDVILRCIARMTSGNRGPSARDIFKSVKNHVPELRVLRKMLEDMVVLGLIEESKTPPGPNGGRPTTRYIIAQNLAS